jgi:hypothetical protein
MPRARPRIQKEADAAKAKAETAATCAQSFLSAFGGVFSGSTLKEGVQATVKELQALQPQCAPGLGQAARVSDHRPPTAAQATRVERPDFMPSG